MKKREHIENMLAEVFDIIEQKTVVDAMILAYNTALLESCKVIPKRALPGSINIDNILSLTIKD